MIQTIHLTCKTSLDSRKCYFYFSMKVAKSGIKSPCQSVIIMIQLFKNIVTRLCCKQRESGRQERQGGKNLDISIYFDWTYQCCNLISSIYTTFFCESEYCTTSSNTSYLSASASLPFCEQLRRARAPLAKNLEFSNKNFFNT